MNQPLVSAQTLDAIGRHRPLRSGLVTASDIRKYCVAVDNRNPLHLDPEAARSAGHADVVAPTLFAHAAMRPTPFQSELLDDGQLPDLAPPGLSHLQSLLAGQEWEFLRPIVAGEWLAEDTWFGAIEERQGRNGPFVFVMEESLISTEAGEPVLRSKNQLIFRPAPPPSAPLVDEGMNSHAIGPQTEWRGARLIKRPSMVALFMFGAVIWATHRLHWDAAQARKEGLPAPVLPGWMVASYLCELAEHEAPGGMRLEGLTLRYNRLAFPGDELTGILSPEPTGCRLSLVNQRGEEVQSGNARFT